LSSTGYKDAIDTSGTYDKTMIQKTQILNAGSGKGQQRTTTSGETSIFLQRSPHNVKENDFDDEVIVRIHLLYRFFTSIEEQRDLLKSREIQERKNKRIRTRIVEEHDL